MKIWGQGGYSQSLKKLLKIYPMRQFNTKVKQLSLMINMLGKSVKVGIRNFYWLNISYDISIHQYAIIIY